MNQAPKYFTNRQKQSFYHDEMINQERQIKELTKMRNKLPDHKVGDDTHIKLIKLRVALTGMRELREKYRRAAKRLHDKMRKH